MRKGSPHPFRIGGIRKYSPVSSYPVPRTMTAITKQALSPTWQISLVLFTSRLTMNRARFT